MRRISGEEAGEERLNPILVRARHYILVCVSIAVRHHTQPENDALGVSYQIYSFSSRKRKEGSRLNPEIQCRILFLPTKEGRRGGLVNQYKLTNLAVKPAILVAEFPLVKKKGGDSTQVEPPNSKHKNIKSSNWAEEPNMA